MKSKGDWGSKTLTLQKSGSVTKIFLDLFPDQKNKSDPKASLRKYI